MIASQVSTLTAHVPGKIMLAGEYAVLLGGRALASTVSLALDVQLQVALDVAGVRVASNLWETPRIINDLDILDPQALQALRTEPLLHAAAHAARRHGLSGVAFKIDSTLDTSFGIGSSSALRLGVGLVAAAYRGLDVEVAARGPAGPYTNAAWTEAREAFNLQRQSQSRASGYDIAVQLAGGLVCFTPAKDSVDWPGEVQTFDASAQRRLCELVHPLVGGRGAPTTPVIRDTLTWLGASNLYAELYDISEHLVEAFAEALAAHTKGAEQRLIAAVAQQRKLLSGSPHFPVHITERLQRLAGFDERWTYKTTGAGGEDALLLIGADDELSEARAALAKIGWRAMPAQFSTAGAQVMETRT